MGVLISFLVPWIAQCESGTCTNGNADGLCEATTSGSMESPFRVMEPRSSQVQEIRPSESGIPRKWLAERFFEGTPILCDPFASPQIRRESSQRQMIANSESGTLTEEIALECSQDTPKESTAFPLEQETLLPPRLEMPLS